MAKDPAFLFYSKDWLQGTAEMLPEEKGVFIDLLAHQHQSEGLPTDTIRLARLCGLSHERFLELWVMISNKFSEVDGRLKNSKLVDVTNDRKNAAHKNKIVGIFGSLIRSSELNEKEKKDIKKDFNVNDFVPFSTDELTERLTEWYSEWLSNRLPSLGNGIGNGNNKVFKKPTKEEIAEYLTKEKNKDEFTAQGFADRFLNYYDSNGWKVGKNPMKDWKATVRTWLSNKTQVTKPTRQRPLLQ